MPRRHPLPPALSGRPFLLSEARALDVSRKVLRGRRMRRLFQGVYVEARIADSLRVRVAGALLVLPGDACVSHHTAAQIRDLPVPDDGCVHATIRRVSQRPRIRGVTVHQASAALSVTWFAGFPVASPGQTFADLAAHLTLVDLTILGDAMIRRGFTTPDELRRAVGAMDGRRGSQMARRSVSLVRQRVDSPMETWVRLLIVLAGLPCPEPGLEVLDDDGQWVATVDLQYPAQRIAIEYDGDLHRTSRRKYQHTVATRERLRELGWEIIVLTAHDVMVRPHHMLRRIYERLRARGHPLLPPAIDPGWEACQTRGRASA
ncbi:MAG TPA: hypothetical protein VE287_05685 [Actinopolymorphaceae bacterium]|nr:hypothetical protein [Actinopolymorphaceae bacterium]